MGGGAGRAPPPPRPPSSRTPPPPATTHGAAKCSAHARQQQQQQSAPTRVGNVVDLALKGSDGGAVPPHVHHNPLYHLPARGAEQHLVAHLWVGGCVCVCVGVGFCKGKRQHGSPAHPPATACAPTPTAPHPRPALASKGLDERMMRPVNRFSRISRPARPTARPPTPPIASTELTSRPSAWRPNTAATAQRSGRVWDVRAGRGGRRYAEAGVGTRLATRAPPTHRPLDMLTKRPATPPAALTYGTLRDCDGGRSTPERRLQASSKGGGGHRRGRAAR